MLIYTNIAKTGFETINTEMYERGAVSFVQRLGQRSSLTARQLEALVNYTRVSSGEIRLKEAASLMSKGRTRGTPSPLTVGSYYRTLAQARTNVEEALATVVIALWLGAARTEDVRRLLEVVSSGNRDLSEEEADRVLQVLDALIRRIVV